MFFGSLGLVKPAAVILFSLSLPAACSLRPQTPGWDKLPDSGIVGPARVLPNQLEKERAKGSTIIDVRPVEAFHREHLVGALNLSADKIKTNDPLMGKLLPRKTMHIIVYGDANYPSLNSLRILAAAQYTQLKDGGNFNEIRLVAPTEASH